MTVKIVLPIAYTATQADIDAGLANNLPKGTSIIVVDSSQQPIDVKTAQGGGTPPVDSAGLKNNFYIGTRSLNSRTKCSGRLERCKWGCANFE